MGGEKGVGAVIEAKMCVTLSERLFIKEKIRIEYMYTNLESFEFCFIRFFSFLPSASCISSRTELIANRCHLFLLFSRIFFDVCESEEERILKLCPT